MVESGDKSMLKTGKKGKKGKRGKRGKRGKKEGKLEMAKAEK